MNTVLQLRFRLEQRRALEQAARELRWMAVCRAYDQAAFDRWSILLDLYIEG